MYVMADRRTLASKPLPSRFSLIAIVKLQPPTSGLWLATNRRYSVTGLGGAGSNQVGVTKCFRHAG